VQEQDHQIDLATALGEEVPDLSGAKDSRYASVPNSRSFLTEVWISYNSPAYLQERHGVPQELLQNIAIVETLAAKAGE
jgi:hypothetical protein